MPPLISMCCPSVGAVRARERHGLHVGGRQQRERGHGRGDGEQRREAHRREAARHAGDSPCARPAALRRRLRRTCRRGGADASRAVERRAPTASAPAERRGRCWAAATPSRLPDRGGHELVGRCEAGAGAGASVLPAMRVIAEAAITAAKSSVDDGPASGARPEPRGGGTAAAERGTSRPSCLLGLRSLALGARRPGRTTRMRPHGGRRAPPPRARLRGPAKRSSKPALTSEPEPARDNGEGRVPVDRVVDRLGLGGRSGSCESRRGTAGVCEDCAE